MSCTDSRKLLWIVEPFKIDKFWFSFIFLSLLSNLIQRNSFIILLSVYSFIYSLVQEIFAEYSNLRDFRLLTFGYTKMKNKFSSSDASNPIEEAMRQLWFIVIAKINAYINVHVCSDSSVQFSCSVVSDSLQPHELQHARPPCPSPTPRVHPNPCALSRWCHPTVSSSVIPFFSCPQSFPASRSFQMSQLFASGGQSTGVSASTSVLSITIFTQLLTWFIFKFLLFKGEFYMI